MPRSQRQIAAGIVLNDGLNFPRDHYDRLRAILFNCARYGPASQNRANHADFRAHLQGRIAHVAMIQPAKGERLRKLFKTIVWE